MQPRHQGGAHGGRASAKIVRAPAKITGLIMFKNLGIFGHFYFLVSIISAFIHDSFPMK